MSDDAAGVCHPGKHDLTTLNLELGHSLRNLSGVDEVAVVAERNATAWRISEGGLRVLPRTRPGRGVARVSDSEVAVKGDEM